MQYLIPGTIYIHVWDCRAVVARYTQEGPNTTGIEYAANWEALEDAAIDEVRAQGGAVTMSGHYGISDELAEQAVFEEDV